MSGAGVQIRYATQEDAPVVAKILERGWRRAFPDRRQRVTLGVLAAETEGETIIVAERRGKVIGFAAVFEPEHFLHHLYVDRRHQRRGVGSALLRTAQAMSGAPISLKTQSVNARARAFYAAHGFTEVERGDDGHGAWVRLRAAA